VNSKSCDYNGSFIGGQDGLLFLNDVSHDLCGAFLVCVFKLRFAHKREENACDNKPERIAFILVLIDLSQSDKRFIFTFGCFQNMDGPFSTGTFLLTQLGKSVCSSF